MFARIKTVAFKGLEAVFTNIEVHFSSALPSFVIVGLAAKAVSESKERVKSALIMLGYEIPAKKITINLTPADIQKDGNHYDLGIAIAILVCMEILSQKMVENFIFIGELSLNGEINYIHGALPASILAKKMGYGIVCPVASAEEALFVGGDITVISSSTLSTLIEDIKNRKFHTVEEPKIAIANFPPHYKDFKDVRGQALAKRALEIATIGNHDVLMVGRPGSGKSMLAERMISIMPSLSYEEMLEISVINSIAGTLQKGKISLSRPFRNPHHSASMVALIGGGKNIKPGEITLAHNGILFLDEFAEFSSFVLDALRQPMETNQVHIARADSHVTFPCRFQLIAAMNPCKCGYLGDPKKECKKAPTCGADYFRKISGPLLERIDIHLEVQPLFEKNSNLMLHTEEEASCDILKRVIKVKEFIKERNQAEFNSNIPDSKITQLCRLENGAEEILNKAANIFNLSLRQYYKTIKLARTIADMDFQDNIQKQHLLEALQFRPQNSN